KIPSELPHVVGSSVLDPLWAVGCCELLSATHPAAVRAQAGSSVLDPYNLRQSVSSIGLIHIPASWSKSTFPPDNTTPTRATSGGSLRNNTAAAEAAPLGSTRIFILASRNFSAARISSSLTSR